MQIKSFIDTGINKPAIFTDIHWGAKGNSVQHNQDCLDYVDWFIDTLTKNNCDSIIFMGDWFENRNAVNVVTLNMSFIALKKLNALNLPIYFCVGNHDLYHRHNRDQFSTYHFSEFSNLILVDQPVCINNAMFFPYLFNSEYADAAALITKYDREYVFGHFEFRNFIVTGTDRRMDHGPDHKHFSAPKYVFSGHFHKRQAHDNVVFIGNTFPTNYGDAWDDDRGMAILDVNTNDVDFINWDDAPKYRKMKLSDVLTSNFVFPKKCRVRCIIDIPIGYSDAQTLKEEMIKSTGLREFSLEENLAEKKDALAGEETLDDFDLSSLNDAVIKMLSSGIPNTVSINSEKLIEIYSKL